MRLKDLAAARPRYGYRRLHVLLQREGWAINHKRVLRLYWQQNLQVRTKRRRKVAARPRVRLPYPSELNERWSLDFVSDELTNGRRYRRVNNSRDDPMVVVWTGVSSNHNERWVR